MKRWRRVDLPLLLVVVSLSSLALLPLATHRAIARTGRQISEIDEPARTLVRRMQLSLALEAASTRGFLLTRDPEYVATHGKARADRKRAYSALVELSPRFGADFHGQVLELGERLRPADALLDALHSGRMTPDLYMTQLRPQDARFRTIIATMGRLGDAVGHQQAMHQEQIRTTQRLDAMLTVPLVLLAFAATIAVARLEHRYRALARSEQAARAASERAQAEAERGRAEVERISASRQMLMQGFTHDVKNPVAVADGWLHMLERGAKGPLTSAQAECVAKARRAITVALQLIADLLDLARAESGAIEVHRAPVDLREEVRRVVDAHRALAEAKGLIVRTDLPTEFPLIESDPSRISQVLGNLIANAIKYTASGGITVRVSLGADATPAGDRHWAIVDVSDTGPGIPDAQRTSVFQEFHRLTTTADAEGSGIGLAIAKRIAEALAGDITVESEVGRGSTFALRLPVSGLPSIT